MVDHPPRRPGSSYRSYPRLVAVSGLLLVVGSSIVYLVDPKEKLLFQVGLSVGAVLILVAVLLRPAAVQLILTGRRPQYASHALIMCLAFVGILLFVNFLSFKHSYEFDLTETGRFTLSTQTIAFLENLTEPVQIVGFFRAGDYRWDRANEFLERYSRYTDLLSYGLHDPISKPSLAESYDIDDYGLIFVNGVHRYETQQVDEQNITTGLMFVTTHRHNGEASDLITIKQQQPTSRHLSLTPFQTGFTFLIAIILIPLVVFTAGTWVWWFRR